MMPKLEEAPDEILRDPVKIYLWKNDPSFNFQQLKIECQNELGRRQQITQKRDRRAKEAAEKDQQDFVNAVFDKIFKEFEPIDGSWNESFEVVDIYSRSERRTFKVSLRDLFKEVFVWSWNREYDPRKNKKGFVNAMIELFAQKPIMVTYPAPTENLKARYDRITFRLRLKKR